MEKKFRQLRRFIPYVVVVFLLVLISFVFVCFFVWPFPVCFVTQLTFPSHCLTDLHRNQANVVQKVSADKTRFKRSNSFGDLEALNLYELGNVEIAAPYTTLQEVRT